MKSQLLEAERKRQEAEMERLSSGFGVLREKLLQVRSRSTFQF